MQNLNILTGISATIALLVIVVATGMPGYWFPLAALVALLAIFTDLLSKRSMQIALGFVVLIGLAWSPIMKTYNYANQGTVGIQVSRLSNEFDSFLGTSRMRSNDLMTYAALLDAIDNAEMAYRNQVLQGLQPGSVGYDQIVEKLEEAKLYYEAKRQRLEQIFKPITKWDLLWLYFQFLLLLAVISFPFWVAPTWKKSPEKFRDFIWKFPVYNLGLIGVCLFIWAFFSKEVEVLRYYKPEYIAGTILAGVLFVSGLAVKIDFPGWHKWTKRFLYIALVISAWNVGWLNGLDITRPEYIRIIKKPLELTSYLECLSEIPGPKPVVPQGNLGITLPNLPQLTSGAPRQTVNQFTPKFAGTLTFGPRKKLGALQGGDMYISFDEDVLYSWDSSSGKWHKLTAGQKLPRSRLLHVDKAVDDTVKYTVWERRQ